MSEREQVPVEQGRCHGNLGAGTLIHVKEAFVPEKYSSTFQMISHSYYKNAVKQSYVCEYLCMFDP